MSSDKKKEDDENNTNDIIDKLEKIDLKIDDIEKKLPNIIEDKEDKEDGEILKEIMKLLKIINEEIVIIKDNQQSFTQKTYKEMEKRIKSHSSKINKIEKKMLQKAHVNDNEKKLNDISSNKDIRNFFNIEKKKKEEPNGNINKKRKTDISESNN